MEKRFVEREIYSVDRMYVMMPCEVVAEGQNWIVTKRPEFYEGKQEADSTMLSTMESEHAVFLITQSKQSLKQSAKSTVMNTLERM